MLIKILHKWVSLKKIHLNSISSTFSDHLGILTIPLHPQKLPLVSLMCYLKRTTWHSSLPRNILDKGAWRGGGGGLILTGSVDSYITILLQYFESYFFFNQMHSELTMVSVCLFKGALGKYNIIPQLFPKKLECCYRACWYLDSNLSKLTYFQRNMNISSFFILFKSKLQQNTIHRPLNFLWLLLTKDHIQWCIGRISWKILVFV